MILVYTESGTWKCKKLKEALDFLYFFAGIGDTTGVHEALEDDKAWYNDGEHCGIEIRDGRELKDVEELPS